MRNSVVVCCYSCNLHPLSFQFVMPRSVPLVGDVIATRSREYVFVRPINRGSTCIVYEAINLKTGARVAIKCIGTTGQAPQTVQRFVDEATMQSRIQHPHVVRVVEWLKSNHRVYIVLELMEGGDLNDRINAAGCLSETTARSYFQQLVCGVNHLHRHGLAHRDVKPGNVLLTQDGRTVKLADFTVTKVTREHGAAMHSCVGTIAYMAPEVLETETLQNLPRLPRQWLHEHGVLDPGDGRRAPDIARELRVNVGYDAFKADVWSLGVVLFTMLAGRRPFDRPTPDETCIAICSAAWTPSRRISAAAMDLISKMLVVDPQRRLSLDGVAAHPWFTENLDASVAALLVGPRAPDT